ncbi:MAG TPA: serine hydrolase [Steroidobacteraceae bacterium]|nr:serine hydrolase [Steroidobacteraceae bacterium]
MTRMLSRALALWVAAGWLAVQAAEPSPFDRAIAAGYKAAFLCSGVFNADRSVEQIEANELDGTYPEYDSLLPALEARIDRERRLVTVEFASDMPPRIAAWRRNLGCAHLPVGADLKSVETLPAFPAQAPDLDGEPWPTGDRDATADPGPAGTALAKVLDRAFAGDYGPGTRTTGAVIVHRGRIVAERYADGFGPHVSQRTWSVAKSLASTVIGVATHRGIIDPSEPAPIPEWQQPGDPRAAITTDLLLRMASGLHSDTAGNRTDPVYFGGVAVTERTVSWPLEVPPGQRFRYANNDTMLAIRGLRARLGDDTRALAFPYEALLWKIGMTRTQLETDWQGNFVLSSQVWSTARDLARLGLLYLNEGIWNGERILPADWLAYVSRPSGPQPDRDLGYGAAFWLINETPGVPVDTVAALGNRGQVIVIVPSREIVVVRRGEDPAGKRFDAVAFAMDTIAALE